MIRQMASYMASEKMEYLGTLPLRFKALTRAMGVVFPSHLIISLIGFQPLKINYSERLRIQSRINQLHPQEILCLIG